MRLLKLFSSSLMFLLIYAASLSGMDQYPSIEAATVYHNHSQQQWTVAFEALKRIEFQGSEQVLDIGCGTGKITANIAGRVPDGSVVGLDVSEGMIAFAERNYSPFYPNLFFLKGDIRDFNPSSTYDIIFSASSLHWILDHQPLLAQIHELLNEQGMILFTIPCTPLAEVSTVFRDVTTMEPWNTYLKDYNHPRRKFTAKEYTLLLTQAGFHNIEVSQVPFTYYFETKRELADWYAAFSPMLSYIPNELHEAFLISIVERYLQLFPLDEMGRVIFKQNELLIKARK